MRILKLIQVMFFHTYATGSRKEGIGSNQMEEQRHDESLRASPLDRKIRAPKDDVRCRKTFFVLYQLHDVHQ